jgi:hypothetical protein
MTKNKINLLIGLGVAAAIGAFIFSRRKPSGTNSADGSDDCGCNNASGVEPDPYMMLEVNEREFPNFSGSRDMLLAKKNYPFGQYFANNPAITVSSRPIRRRNRGTYKF